MNNFQYARAADVADAVRQIAADPAAKFIAGGTNLIDLMKYDVERPARLIDITHLPLKTIEETSNGGLRIGALVRTATSPTIRGSSNAIRCCRARSWRARRSNCATWHRPAAICCSARAAFISMTRRRLATNGSPAAAARPSTASTGSMLFSARAMPASRRIHPTCASRSLRWKPRFMWQAPPASARSRSPISIGCRAIRRNSTPISRPTRSSRRSSCRRRASQPTTAI